MIEERTIGFASPLAAAAGRGHLDVVDLLIARGANVDPEGVGLPILSFPIANRRLDVVERLLKAGAPVVKYRSHFRLAVKNRHWDMVDAMLAGGADPAWLTEAERADLDAFTVREKPRSEDYRKRLREDQEGQIERARVNRAGPPLDAAERASREAEAIAEIERDPKLALARSDGATPVLALAVGGGARELVEVLLSKGADPNDGGSAESPLARAASRSDAALVDVLLKAGADPNRSVSGSPHPLTAAARAGSLACVESLLARGARPRARDLKVAIEQAGGPDAKAIAARLEALKSKAPRASRVQPAPRG